MDINFYDFPQKVKKKFHLTVMNMISSLLCMHNNHFVTVSWTMSIVSEYQSVHSYAKA